MGPGLRLELRQSQQLVMTPQLQQAIKLLQMSNLDLKDFVAAEVERNPLLEEAPPESPVLPTGPPPDTVAETAERADDRMATAGPELAVETFDTGHENLAADGPGDAPRGAEPMAASRASSGRQGGETLDGIETRLADRPTLRSHLRAQIGQMRAPAPVPMLAALLVEELDEHGLIRRPLDEIGAPLDAPPGAMEQALALLQRCEPTGVGARSLAECLGLQLAERGRLDPAMQAMIDNLDLLGRGELKRLRQLCRVDAEDFAEMLAELRALDPRPCDRFGVEEPQTVVPDAFLRAQRTGGWEVELNTDTLPRVLVNHRYAAALDTCGDETKRFVTEMRESAGWLARSLDQRARTILKVSTEIVRQQDGFFRDGVGALRPLNLRMVADAVGVHESTASRVTSNKYLGTPRGVFELKFFFTNAVGSGEGVAAEAVRQRVRGLVAAEGSQILSDDRIVELLMGEGMEIARRTVAKYRKSLGIPSSVERRRALALRPGA